jgi:hypothetical protein
MPWYHIHFRENGYTHLDEVGPICLKEAEQEATVTAAALLRDAAAERKCDDICVEVSNAAGFAIVTICASIRVQQKGG